MTSFLAVLVSGMLYAGLAQALEMPKGQVILTVKGAVSNTNVGGSAVFDRDMLSALPGREAEIPTPWAPEPTRFGGAYLRAVLEAAGADGTRIVIRALNDYSAELPVSDARQFDTILADRIDGQPMSVREKGPLMVVYPFDTRPELYTERYFARSVWQIREIEVLP